MSIKLNVQSFHWTGILADWIVIPRARSAGRKSVVVLPVSTEPAESRYDDLSRIDSVKVVFPESSSSQYWEHTLLHSHSPMCATSAIFLNFDGSFGSCVAYPRTPGRGQHGFHRRKSDESIVRACPSAGDRSNERTLAPSQIPPNTALFSR